MIKNFFKMKKNNNSKKKKISINEPAKILPKPKINYVNKFLCYKPNLLPQKYLAEKKFRRFRIYTKRSKDKNGQNNA